MDFEVESSFLADQILEVGSEEAKKFINEELIGNAGVFKQIEKVIGEFLLAVIKYEDSSKLIGSAGGINAINQILELKKELIYSKFFELQNLINAYIGQRVVMTYVYTDPDTGRRAIKVMDNDIEHLMIQSGNSYGRDFVKLSYMIEHHQQNLKNSLNDNENEALQQTAMAVEWRYNTYKRRVLWKPSGQDWKGYRFPSRGPINEAYVNCYIHNIQLTNGLENNIDEFILGPYGAIHADATPGFLIGDVRQEDKVGGIQYAVKGNFASPQGYKQVAKDLQKIYDSSQGILDPTGFNNFIEKYTKTPQLKSQIQELTNKTMSGMLRYWTGKESKGAYDIPVHIDI